MIRAFGILLGLSAVLLVQGCSTGPSVGGQEPYQGQFAAGVVLPGGPYGEAVQRRLIAELDASGRFAGVFPLRSSSQNTEVEIIVEPTVVSARTASRGFERLDLRVTAFRKPSRTSAFNKTYQGKASGNGDALNDVANSVARDITRRFGAKPVF